MKIVVVSGASGGHIFPALAFIDALGKDVAAEDIILVLPKRIFINEDLLAGYPVLRSRMRCFALKKIRGWRDFILAWLDALRLLSTEKPDLVAGFGSIASVPFLFLAWVFRIPTLIHEQNVSAGLANIFLSLFVDKVAFSFSQTAKQLFWVGRRGVISGNPLRSHIAFVDKETARKDLGLCEDKFTILVLGGSQGSRIINEAVMSAVAELKERFSFQVVHISGQTAEREVKGFYQRQNILAAVFGFLPQIHLAYSSADIAVCRAGASVTAELIFFKLPAVLIPYPFARGHQRKNAAFLRDNAAAILLEEDQIDNLAGVLEDLLSSPQRLRKMRESYLKLSRDDAAELLRREALQLLG